MKGIARKKVVDLEFIQLKKDNIVSVMKFIDPSFEAPKYGTTNRQSVSHDKFGDYIELVKRDGLALKTLESGEGTQIASIGDYIMKGVKGEFYPVKPDIFPKLYDVIESDK